MHTTSSPIWLCRFILIQLRSYAQPSSQTCRISTKDLETRPVHKPFHLVRIKHCVCYHNRLVDQSPARCSFVHPFCIQLSCNNNFIYLSIRMNILSSKRLLLIGLMRSGSLRRLTLFYVFMLRVGLFIYTYEPVSQTSNYLYMIYYYIATCKIYRYLFNGVNWHYFIFYVRAKVRYLQDSHVFTWHLISAASSRFDQSLLRTTRPQVHWWKSAWFSMQEQGNPVQMLVVCIEDGEVIDYRTGKLNSTLPRDWPPPSCSNSLTSSFHKDSRMWGSESGMMRGGCTEE